MHSLKKIHLQKSILLVFTDVLLENAVYISIIGTIVSVELSWTQMCLSIAKSETTSSFQTLQAWFYPKDRREMKAF